MSKGISINIKKCMACRNCEIACAVEHSSSKILENAIKEHPLPHNRITIEGTNGYAVPIQCRHCENAPCMRVCPASAIYREAMNSPVLIENSRCIGCNNCIMVCPFGAIDISLDCRQAVKCDLCIERTKAGKEPACVESCPTNALVYCETEDLIKSRRAAAVEILADTGIL